MARFPLEDNYLINDINDDFSDGLVLQHMAIPLLREKMVHGLHVSLKSSVDNLVRTNVVRYIVVWLLTSLDQYQQRSTVAVPRRDWSSNTQEVTS